jgi:hypothetical protein
MMCVDSLPEPRVFPDQSNSAIDRCEKSGSQFTALGSIELCCILVPPIAAVASHVLRRCAQVLPGKFLLLYSPWVDFKPRPRQALL